MSVLLRAAELVKRPVVTLAGDDVAQIKDVIYSSRTGELAGFTLNGRGLFAGPLRKTLPWANVHGLGPAAVMIRDESGLADRKALRGETEGAGGAVLGSSVITQSGRNLGRVTDVILAVGDTVTDAVGYEIDSADPNAPRRQFVPLPDALAVSGEALILPDAATEFIRDDLAGFGAAVEEFRSRLRGQESAAAVPAAAPTRPVHPTPPTAPGPPTKEEPVVKADEPPVDAALADPAGPPPPAGETVAGEPVSPVPIPVDPVPGEPKNQARTDKLSLDGPTAGGQK